MDAIFFVMGRRFTLSRGRQ
ncbi:hypothetical protein, partial [Kingella kingae]